MEKLNITKFFGKLFEPKEAVKALIIKINEIIDSLNSSGPAYKEYVAILNQSGTNAPEATIVSNEIGNIVWARTGEGSYTGTLTNGFPLTKTVAFINDTNEFVNIRMFIGVGDDNTVYISTQDGITPTDDLLGQTYILIRVYN